MTETPSTVHGRLLESLHLSGYTFNRACDELGWLLNDDRWKQCGSGFNDFGAFAETIRLALPKFDEAAALRRKTLAKRFTELGASQRATAEALGVDESTIRADLGKRRAGNPALTPVGAARENESEEPNAGTPARDPAWFQDDVDPAKLAKGRSERKKRDREAEERKLAEASEPVELHPDADVRHGDFREVLADLESVDAVITDPPYAREHLPLLRDLATWADKVLTPDGVLAVLFGQTHLPEVYRLLDGFRPYRWTACLLTPGPGYVSHAGRVQSGWKPVLLYGAGPRLEDVIRSEGENMAAKEHHEWGQDAGAYLTLVRRLTTPGALVADPFMGSGTTLVAARALGRRGVGADVNPESVAEARRRLAA